MAKVNGEVWDLDRPLEDDCSLQLLKFDDDEGKAVFWHSSAHILGEAMERVYGGHLCYGPPIESGFYYDMHTNSKVRLRLKARFNICIHSRSRRFNWELCVLSQVSDADFKCLDDVVKKIVKEKQPFERLEMKKEDLLDMFQYNTFKVRTRTE